MILWPYSNTNFKNTQWVSLNIQQRPPVSIAVSWCMFYQCCLQIVKSRAILQQRCTSIVPLSCYIYNTVWYIVPDIMLLYVPLRSACRAGNDIPKVCINGFYQSLIWAFLLGSVNKSPSTYPPSCNQTYLFGCGIVEGFTKGLSQRPLSMGTSTSVAGCV